MLHMRLEGVPISTNAAYIKGRGGRRILSPEGKQYKLTTATDLTRRYFREIKNLDLGPQDAITLLIRIHLPIYNSTYGQPKGATNKYKEMDVTNRIKLLEDVLAKVLGLDDANNLTAVTCKCNSEQLRTDIVLWLPEKEQSPLDDAIERVFA